MTWTITLTDGKTENVTCKAMQMSPHGALILTNAPNEIVAMYNVGQWVKAAPSVIQGIPAFNAN